MSKNEIQERIAHYTESIKSTKEGIKKLEKAAALMTEVGVNTTIVENAIVDLRENLDIFTAEINKRKKQMKLLAQFEALND